MSLASEISSNIGGKKSGKGYLMKCPLHDDKNDSLMVSDSTDQKGNPDVKLHCFAGCDWRKIKDHFRQQGLLPEFKPIFQGTPPILQKTPLKKNKTNFIWKQAAKDEQVTAAVLKHRGITTGFDSQSIRCGTYKDQKMLVLAMTKPGDNKVLAIQRMNFDSETFEKTGKGMMYGKNGDGENYCHRRGVYFYRKRPVENFIVGEGVETTLSCMQAINANGCACLSTAGLQNISLPVDGIKNLYICVDSDKNFAGQKAGAQLAERYKNKIENIFIVAPCASCFSDAPDKIDFNDLLMCGGGEESIKNRFGAAVNFKDFSWSPPDAAEANGGLTPESVKALKKINERYAAVLLSGNFRILKEGFSTAEQRNTLYFLKTSSFLDFFKKEKVFVEKDDEDPKPVQMGKAWLEWSGRRTYEDVVFNPANTHSKDDYNIFKSLIEPKKGDWACMRQHTKEMICDGDIDHYRYMMAWLAHIVQNPGGDKPGVAIVLKGGKGIGKSAWADYYGAIFGESYFPISDSDSFTGRFNMYQSKTLLLFLDEAVWGGNKKSEGKMKALITQPTNMFEPKGIDAIPMRNFMSIIIAGNENWLVPATPDERRFFALAVNPTYRKNKLYFDAFYKELRNGGASAMLYDLLEYDFSDVNLRDAPITEALGTQIEESLPAVLAFWQAVIYRGFLLSDTYSGRPVSTTCDNEYIGAWPCNAWKYELYNEFQAWCTKKKEKFIITESTFWRKTWDIWPGGKPARKQRQFDGQRWDFITLPELSVFLMEFEKITKVKIQKRNDTTDDTSFDFGANIECTG